MHLIGSLGSFSSNQLRPSTSGQSQPLFSTGGGQASTVYPTYPSQKDIDFIIQNQDLGKLRHYLVRYLDGSNTAPPLYRSECNHLSVVLGRGFAGAENADYMSDSVLKLLVGEWVDVMLMQLDDAGRLQRGYDLVDYTRRLSPLVKVIDYSLENRCLRIYGCPRLLLKLTEWCEGVKQDSQNPLHRALVAHLARLVSQEDVTRHPDIQARFRGLL